jgi:hypothetical protein
MNHRTVKWVESKKENVCMASGHFRDTGRQPATSRYRPEIFEIRGRCAGFREGCTRSNVNMRTEAIERVARCVVRTSLSGKRVCRVIRLMIGARAGSNIDVYSLAFSATLLHEKTRLESSSARLSLRPCSGPGKLISQGSAFDSLHVGGGWRHDVPRHASP